MIGSEKVKNFAIHAHRFRTRDGVPQTYDSKPYQAHLLDVAANILRFKNCLPSKCLEELVTACWLHDTLEDTDVTYEELQKEFGIVVADIVFAVTTEHAPTREEAFAKTYPKIRANSLATIVKLADRISNTEASLKLFFVEPQKRQFLHIYVNEWDKFHYELCMKSNEVVAVDMWTHLRDLYGNPVYAFNAAVGDKDLQGLIQARKQ